MRTPSASGLQSQQARSGKTEPAKNKRLRKSQNAQLADLLEAERARIARDLHDHVSQKIAALSIALSKIKTGMMAGNSILPEDVSTLIQQVKEIAGEIRNVSHAVHPAFLSKPGLQAAMQNECDKFSTNSGTDVQLYASGDLSSLPVDVALCVYRVFQESMHNIQTHADAKIVKVFLTRTSKYVELIVEDNGRGFDHKKALKHGGLGLFSMDERVRLMRGHIRIQTQPWSGTNVQLQIPITIGG